jgi:hypothetical protein
MHAEEMPLFIWKRIDGCMRIAYSSISGYRDGPLIATKTVNEANAGNKCKQIKQSTCF